MIQVNFNTVAELVALAEAQHVPVHEIVLAREMHDRERSRGEVLQAMLKNWQVMQESIVRGIQNTERSLSGMTGGTPAMIGNGAALAIKNLMGLVCDPVAGLVEVPCVKRNGFATVVAMTAADMTMAGIRSVIPVDEVIAAMNEVGHLLPKSLRETSEAGLAVTPTAKAIEKRVYPD